MSAVASCVDGQEDLLGLPTEKSSNVHVHFVYSTDLSLVDFDCLWLYILRYYGALEYHSISMLICS